MLASRFNVRPRLERLSACAALTWSSPEPICPPLVRRPDFLGLIAGLCVASGAANAVRPGIGSPCAVSCQPADDTYGSLLVEDRLLPRMLCAGIPRARPQATGLDAGLSRQCVLDCRCGSKAIADRGGAGHRTAHRWQPHVDRAGRRRTRQRARLSGQGAGPIRPKTRPTRPGASAVSFALARSRLAS